MIKDERKREREGKKGRRGEEIKGEGKRRKEREE